MIRLLAALLLAAALPARAANSFTTDFSDLWWNPAESGWGAMISHQMEIVFVTLYVYDRDGNAKWYVAPELVYAAASDTSVSFVGALYETRGPFLGGPFNPSAVSLRRVGSANLRFTLVNAGTLTYDVDGVQVVKAIQRQTFRTNEFNSNFYGGITTRTTGCGATQVTQNLVEFSVGVIGNQTTITAKFPTRTCTFSGTYTQQGRLGSIRGTGTCTDGKAGTFAADEIEASQLGFIGAYLFTYGSCRELGKMAGANQ